MKTLTRLLIGAVLLFTVAHHAFDALKADAVEDFKNEAGWIWHIKPQPLGWTMTATAGLVLRQDELKGDKLLITLAYSVQANRDVVKFRPVAFNASRERFEFSHESGGSSGEAALQGFLLDLKTLPLDQINSLGIEKLTQENLREVVAPAAFQRLKDAGANALPFPRLGERYEFDLMTIDGKKISSKNFAGKVVLLDFWAKWCGPCMAKMPKLKEIYQQWHSRGFEVLGLNHDPTLSAAKRIIEEQLLPWTNVVAPVDGGQRELWWGASGTRSLPRLLLIDRDGLLRAELSPDELASQIEALMLRR